MSATIRSFSFLIKPKSLFFDLVEELHANEQMTTDELVCYLIRMFGGTSIKIPSVNELKLFQYLITNYEKYRDIIIGISDPKNVCDILSAAIRKDYHGDLYQTDFYQVISGFVEAVTSLDVDAAKIKHNRKDLVLRNKKRLTISKYRKERAKASDDCPPEDYND